MKRHHVKSYKNECSGDVGVATKPDCSLNVAGDTYGGGCMVSNLWYQGTELNDHSRSLQFSLIFLWTASIRQFRPT